MDIEARFLHPEVLSSVQALTGRCRVGSPWASHTDCSCWLFVTFLACQENMSESEPWIHEWNSSFGYAALNLRHQDRGQRAFLFCFQTLESSYGPPGSGRHVSCRDVSLDHHRASLHNKDHHGPVTTAACLLWESALLLSLSPGCSQGLFRGRMGLDLAIGLSGG